MCLYGFVPFLMCRCEVVNDLLHNLVPFFKKSFHPPFLGTLANLAETFSLTERVAILCLSALLGVSVLGIAARIGSSLLVEVPAQGGSLREGIVGSPRFVNPILALGDADRDLAALVYSGLMKATPQGNLIPDLAESYEVSSDGLSYTFTLREDLVFHDGEPLTTDDIVFTVTKAQEPLLKSPRRAAWDGIRVEKVNERSVRFVLNQPYTPFLQNATMGILPKHIWQNVSTEEFPFSKYNIEPIGSGQYMIDTVHSDSSGVPRSFDLEPFPHYALGKPFIKRLKIFFYGSEEDLLGAVEDGTVESMGGVSVALARKLEAEGRRIERFPLPRIFAVFFNQNHAPIFAFPEVREALDAALDKKRIVEEVLEGYGTPIAGPVPPGLLAPIPANPNEVPNNEAAHLVRARSILAEAGWKMNDEDGVLQKKVGKETMPLFFSLATSDVPELKKTAVLIAETWRTLGARVDLKVFESGDLNQNVIRPRKYDALLFGEIVGRDLDLFAFWHSSQRSDPGLNIALYANITADRLLEQARTTRDDERRAKAYDGFQQEIQKDLPAVFLYAPDFIYLLPEKIGGFSLGAVTTPSERFNSIEQWYIETERVWPIFVKK